MTELWVVIIHSFIKFLESTYSVPDIILGAIRDKAVNKTD